MHVFWVQNILMGDNQNIYYVLLLCLSVERINHFQRLDEDVMRLFRGDGVKIVYQVEVLYLRIHFAQEKQCLPEEPERSSKVCLPRLPFPLGQRRRSRQRRQVPYDVTTRSRGGEE